MSWQTYVDTNLVGTGKITKGAIYGHDKSTWASTSGFELKPNEIDAILQAFNDASGIRANGVRIAEQKYFALKCDDRSIYCKLGSGGAVLVKTKQALLVGLYDTPTQPGEASKVVETLADYLISVNYTVYATNLTTTLFSLKLRMEERVKEHPTQTGPSLDSLTRSAPSDPSSFAAEVPQTADAETPAERSQTGLDTRLPSLTDLDGSDNSTDFPVKLVDLTEFQSDEFLQLQERLSKVIRSTRKDLP